MPRDVLEEALDEPRSVTKLEIHSLAGPMDYVIRKVLISCQKGNSYESKYLLNNKCYRSRVKINTTWITIMRDVG